MLLNLQYLMEPSHINIYNSANVIKLDIQINIFILSMQTYYYGKTYPAVISVYIYFYLVIYITKVINQL